MKKVQYKKPLILIFLSVIIAGYATDTSFADYRKNKIPEYTLKTEKFNNNSGTFVIFSKNPIKTVKSTDEKVVSAKILPTVMNDRNTIVLDLYSYGNARILVNIEDREYEIYVNHSKTLLDINTKCKLFEIIQLDIPDNKNGEKNG